MTSPCAHPDRVSSLLPALQLHELADHGAGLIKAAGNPGQFCAYPQVIDVGGKSYLYVTKPRYCWLFGSPYLGFCYPDRKLFRHLPELMTAVRQLVQHFFAPLPDPRTSIRATFTNLSGEEYARLLEYSRFEEQGRIDPEGLQDFIPWERTIPTATVALQRSRCQPSDRCGWEWRRGQVLVRPAPADHLTEVYELQTALNSHLGLDYGQSMRTGLRELLGYDFRAADAVSLRRLATHGTMLETLYNDEVVAVGWFYRSFNAPLNRCELWNRRSVVRDGFKGKGYGRALRDAAIGMFSEVGRELRLRSLVHPRASGQGTIWAKTANLIESGSSMSRTVYALAGDGERRPA